MTTEAKVAHTPAPWTVFDTPTAIGVTGPRNADVAWTYSRPAGLHDTRRSRAEDEANARLIAAAPDLLAALNKINTLACFTQENHDARDEMLLAIGAEARAAIAKADGQ